MSNKLTEGSIIKSLLTIAIPIVFAQLLQTAYQLTDTFWVGKLGQDAIAAVSLSFPITFLMISLGGGLAIAGTILVAQYKGKNNREQIDFVATQTLLMMLAVSIFSSIVGYLLTEPIIRFMGVEPEVYVEAVNYLRITFLGIIFTFAFFMYQSLMRGVGEVKTPLYIVLVTVVLNFILDPLFIYGFGPIPAAGVSGAAIATIGTQAIATIWGITGLFSGKFGIHIKLKNLKPDWKLMSKMFRLGFPSSIEQSTRALGLTVITLLVTSFGTTAIAAYGIGTRVFSFIIIPALGMAMATSTLVGQNIGANKVERAEQIVRKSALLSFTSLTFIGILCFISAENIATFFAPGEAETIMLTSQYIKIMSLTYGFVGLGQVFNGTFTGAGNTLISMIFAIVSIWVLQFPLGYILSKHTTLGIEGIWWSTPATNLIAVLISGVYFLRGTWKTKKITEEMELLDEVREEVIIEEGIRR